MNEPRNLRTAYVEKLRACEISLKERIIDRILSRVNNTLVKRCSVIICVCGKELSVCNKEHCLAKKPLKIFAF